MAKGSEEVMSRSSIRISNKETTSPSTSMGENWVPSLPPDEEVTPPTFFRDLLNAKLHV